MKEYIDKQKLLEDLGAEAGLKFRFNARPIAPD